MIRVLLVDDHALIRSGIDRLLSDIDDIDVIGEAANGEEAIQQCKALQPDVVLMDVSMPGMGGLEAIKRISTRYPDIRILAVTAHTDEPYPSRVIQAGAAGYMTKGAGAKEMQHAILMTHTGQRHISQDIAQNLALKQLGDKKGDITELLSEREVQIMIMITSGKRVKDISKKLNLSAKTVNSYRYRIFEKLDLNSDVELTHFALRYNLIDAQ